MDRAWGVAERAPELWGRDAEIDLVERGVDVGEGAVHGVLIVGEPGIGKSSLWARGVSAARRAGARVLDATCVRAESDMPYVVLDDLIGELFDEHRDALPPPQREALDAALLRAPLEDDVDPRTVAVGVLTVLRHAVDVAPVVLAVDDVQWADRETQDCLAYALRRLHVGQFVPLLVVRERSPWWTPPRAATDVLLTLVASTARTVRPGPLSGTAVARMLESRLGLEFSPETGARVAAETGGNPFWALEYGDVEIAHSRATTSTTSTTPVARRPPALAALVDERIAHMRRGAVDVACLVAALGRPRAATVLSVADDGNDVDSAESVLDEAVAHGLVALVDGRLRPSHPLIGAALLASLPPFRLRRLHRRAADLVESVEARALHLLQAFGDLRDDAVSSTGSQGTELLAALDAAAVAARRRGAPSAAARLAGRALLVVERSAAALDGTPDAKDGRSRADSRASRRVTTAEWHYQAGERDEVLAVLEPVDLATLHPDLLEQTALLLAQTTNERRGGPAARVVVEELDRIPRNDGEASARHRALLSTLRADPLCGALGDRRRAAQEAVDQTDAAPVRPSLRRRALEALAGVLLEQGEPVQHVLDRLEVVGAPEALVSGGTHDAEYLRGLVLRSAFDMAASRAVFAAAVERHQASGDAPRLTHTAALLINIDLLAGRTAEAEATLALLEDHVDRHSVRCPHVVWARGDLHLVHDRRRELDELLARVDVDGDRSALGLAMAARLHGLLALRRDDPERAVGFLRRVAKTYDDLGVADPRHRLGIDVPLASASIRVSDHATAADLAVRLGAFARSSGRPELRSQQHQLLALLAAHRDEDLDRALVHARAAVDASEHGEVPGEVGRSLVVLSDLMMRCGQFDEGTACRRRAHSVFVECGDRWWQARTTEADHQTRVPGHGATRSADVLSPSERVVAELVATGVSNRAAATALHLSVRTVENHLRAAYRKLGISSRDELPLPAP